MISMVVFGFIILTFVFWGYYESGSPSATALTTVNGQEVSYAEYQRVLNRELERYGQMFGGEGLNRSLVELVERQVALVLVTRKALAQEAERLGIVVGRQDVVEELRQFEVFHNPDLKRFDPRVYQDVLRANRITPRSFEQSIAEELAATRLRRLVENSVRVTSQEIEDYRRIQEFSMRLHTARLTTEGIRKSGKVLIEEEDVRAEYEAFPTRYRSPEKRSLRLARLDLIEKRRGIEIEPSAVQDYYEAEVADSDDPRWEQQRARALHILVSEPGEQGRREARKIYQDLSREYDKLDQARFENFFRQLAKNKSDDYNSAFRGGDLGYLTPEETDEKVAEALFSARPFSLLQPVQSDFGYHIIYILDQSSASNSLSNRQKEIEYILAEAKAEEQLETLRSQLNTQVSGRPQDFSPLLEELGFQITVTDPLDQREREATLPYILIQRAFESPALQWQSPEEFEDNIYMFRVEEVFEPEPMPFEEAREQVWEDLYQSRVEGLLQEWGEAIAAGDREWNSLRELGATLHEGENFKVFQEETVPGFDQSDLLLRQAQSLSEQQPLRGPSFFRDDFVFLYGTDFHSPSDDITMEERQFIEEEILTAKRASVIESFVDRVIKRSRIPREFRERHEI